MKKAIRIITGIVVLAAAALATGNGSIIASFGSDWARGFDYHGGYLYFAHSINNQIHVRTTTGSYVSTIYVGAYVKANGIARTDAEFWTCSSTGYIHHLNTGGGLLDSFTIPFNAQAIEYGGGYLWCTSGAALYKITTSGSVVSSFPAPGSSVYGVSWDAPYLWVCEGSYSGAIYQVTTSGSIIRSIPRNGHQPYDVAWDGRYVWYTNYSPNWVYAMTIAMTSVEPASLGRVKAVFR
ncbi:MAG TPA: hypothetical protein VMW93_04510 [bacterium]|nr:hypothetical protein [bacterium]